MSKLIVFLKDVRVELAKVTWPTRRETVHYTLIVMGSSVAVAIFLGIWDALFQWILQNVVLK